MKHRLAVLGILLIVLALTACAQLHTWVKPVFLDSVTPEASSGVPAAMKTAAVTEDLEAGPRKALILPFADYSSGDAPSLHLQTHATLQHELIQSLQAAGFAEVVCAREVTDQLIRAGVIQDAAPIVREESPRTSVLLFEMEEGNWSPAMSERIGSLIHQNLISTQSLQQKVESTPLDSGTIRDLARMFDADYVVRGRMTVYQSGLKWSRFIHPKGVLAFYFQVEGRKAPFMGVSNLGAYEWLQDGPSAPPPASVRSEDNLPEHKRGQKYTPLVRVDVFLQDASTGDVVYSASALTRSRQAYTLSRHGRSEPYNDIDRAIAHAVAHAVDPLQ